ncbi:hypothetical protein ABIC64_002949 [Plantibacter flavus]
MTNWALRDVGDSVYEPSAGDAEFLVDAVRRLKELSTDPHFRPVVNGVEIHEQSALAGRQRVRAAGGEPSIEVNDFFLVDSAVKYTAAIGNPPYVRYQDWSGEARLRSREAALRAGVPLTGLASSWASFVVHSTSILQDGGRLALVLPAELLSVNYAAPIRAFLFNHFRTLEIVLFESQVFPEAEADVVLLLADGFNSGPTDHAFIRHATDAESLVSLDSGSKWSPEDPAGKWTGAGLITPEATIPMRNLRSTGAFVDLEVWGDTTLGIVTGNNRFFALSPRRANELGLRPNELIKLSPPGSAHLRGLELTRPMWDELGRGDKQTWLFYPGVKLSSAAEAYIEAGRIAGVNEAYKCRVRKTWFRVPIMRPADLLLTCMNADTPRLTTNSAGVHHLNSIHGVYLHGSVRELGRELLPLASLNSITLLHAEMVGRAYGGGILKLEPREADLWSMPSPDLVLSRADALRTIRGEVVALLRQGRLLDAVRVVDGVMFSDQQLVDIDALAHIRASREVLASRRATRGKSG